MTSYPFSAACIELPAWRRTRLLHALPKFSACHTLCCPFALQFVSAGANAGVRLLGNALILASHHRRGRGFGC